MYGLTALLELLGRFEDELSGYPCTRLSLDVIL